MKFINQFRFYYIISLMGIELDIRTEEQSGVGKKVSILHLLLHIKYARIGCDKASCCYSVSVSLPCPEGSPAPPQDET